MKWDYSGRKENNRGNVYPSECHREAKEYIL
jgi:hypothetical protein